MRQGDEDVAGGGGRRRRLRRSYGVLVGEAEGAELIGDSLNGGVGEGLGVGCGAPNEGFGGSGGDMKEFGEWKREEE